MILNVLCKLLMKNYIPIDVFINSFVLVQIVVINISVCVRINVSNHMFDIYLFILMYSSNYIFQNILTTVDISFAVIFRFI